MKNERMLVTDVLASVLPKDSEKDRGKIVREASTWSEFGWKQRFASRRVLFRGVALLTRVGLLEASVVTEAVTSRVFSVCGIMEYNGYSVLDMVFRRI
ncbi:hypothetical protein E2C01_079940 [Portunus trituberculatus]|uniref:Uncharacterized protein n=1 Tax=Portunus trituberculatus TaxID=210409 RepID=A0A5B7IUN2_PORTR|nr:hypothetical protein [Portunus trituberculatus]